MRSAGRYGDLSLEAMMRAHSSLPCYTPSASSLSITSASSLSITFVVFRAVDCWCWPQLHFSSSIPLPCRGLQATFLVLDSLPLLPPRYPVLDGGEDPRRS